MTAVPAMKARFFATISYTNSSSSFVVAEGNDLDRVLNAAIEVWKVWLDFLFRDTASYPVNAPNDMRTLGLGISVWDRDRPEGTADSTIVFWTGFSDVASLDLTR